MLYHKTKRRNHPIRHGMRIVVSLSSILCTLAMAVILAAGFWVVVYLSSNYENSIEVSLFTAATRGGATKVFRYDFTDRATRTGEVVELEGEQLFGGGNSIFVPYEEVPQDLIDAFIAIEDKRFLTHDGVDWYRSIAAGLNFIGGSGSTFGGSSITQQLIKNITGEKDFSPERKIQEIIWALDLETKLDKTEIIEIYMNIINLSHGCTGVQAAANTYFSKDVSELTLIECAAIAAITNNPGYYDPVRNPANNRKRRDIILEQMLEQGYITQEEFGASHGKELVTDLTRFESSDGINSWYVDMALEDVIADLCAEYGYSTQAASMMVYSGGLRIYTAMDSDVQRTLEEYYANRENFPDLGPVNPFQSGMIIIDPATGDILGVAGAVGEKTANRVQNYATTAKRPSGSTIKPLSVYAPALDAGLITSASVYDDVPVSFRNAGGALAAWPKNAPAVYRGLTNIKTAISESVNTVAVRVLAELGERESYNFLVEKAGIRSLIDKRVLNDGSVISDIGAASLALGQQNYGVTARELTAAYSMFANSGIFNETRSYIKVTDAAGNVILSKDYTGTRAISAESAAIMTLLLENVVTNGTAKSVTLDAFVPVAGKTGTTQDNKDKWFVAYTPYLIGGVWGGCEYPASLDGISNYTCMKIWDEVMTILHAKYVSGAAVPAGFSIPENIVRVKVCADSGKLMSASCRADPRGDRGVWCWFAAGGEPTDFCDTHITVDYNSISGGIVCPLCPPESIKKVGLIRAERSFPVQIYVTDAQYTWRRLPKFVNAELSPKLPFYNKLLGNDRFSGISNVNAQYNRSCPGH